MTIEHGNLLRKIGVEQYLNLLCIHTYLDLEPISVDFERLPAVNWDLFTDVANANRTWPMMLVAVAKLQKQYGWTPQIADAQLTDWEKRFEASKMRHVVAHGELVDIAGYLGQSNIDYVAMKGASTSLVERVWPRMGDRLLGDIDLLVPRSQLMAAAEALQEKGYEFESDPTESTSEHQLPPLVHPKRMMPIELHFEVCLRSWRDRMPAEQLLSDSRRIDVQDTVVCVPSEEHLYRHCLLHASLFLVNGHRRYFPTADLMELKLLQERSKKRTGTDEAKVRKEKRLLLAQAFEFVTCDYDTRIAIHPKPRTLATVFIGWFFSMKRMLSWRHRKRGTVEAVFDWLTYKAFALFVRGRLGRNDFRSKEDDMQ